MANELVRLHVNLNQETAAALKQLAANNGDSLTETVRRAVAVLKFVKDENENGRDVIVMNKNGRNKRELVLM